MSEQVVLSWGAGTDRGLRRATNQDAYLAEPPVFLVADGMGGHDGGAEASRAAIDGFRPLIGRRAVTVADVEAAFASALGAVEAVGVEGLAAGTTLAGAAICEEAGATYWLILNVGDSRTYRLVDGVLEQVSVDHSAVQALVERGEIDAAAAARHPHRNVVTRALGAGSSAVPDYWLLPAEAGDRILVCSDGLTKDLADARIEEILRAESSAQAAATRLVHEALLHGGHDNVTAVVADLHALADADEHPTSPADADTVPRAPEEGERVAQL
ncbi:PP2C family protein-serine/threonine phosphatase [Microbacterium album]|uniref:Serine/threonine protein phosphatase n=1 Tax=Microbacterium album TaxID=2053191 RepID=A0A917IEP3_9MICO|nr:protein phosphatase 2C domain-containing protein [Microbacterium album]GGH42255.1 serine/threonine protein phosphatase [Microbacterium album]